MSPRWTGRPVVNLTCKHQEIAQFPCKVAEQAKTTDPQRVLASIWLSDICIQKTWHVLFLL